MNNDLFTLIMHKWNLFLVPTSSLKDRPEFSYRNDGVFESTGDACKRHGYEMDSWFRRLESYYVTQELIEVWGIKHGYGGEKKTDKVIKGVDFNVERRDYTFGVKIARGVPDTKIVNGNVAIPVMAGSN